MDPLLVILGPTAVGKTKVAISIAERLDGEIISADSMQVYRYLNIGTAKPTLEERKNIPHHLMDVLEPSDKCNVAWFQREAKRCITKITNRGNLPILVGGTGLYINAVVNNYQFVSKKPNPYLRQRLLAVAEEQGYMSLYKLLVDLDLESARGIEPTDTRRIVRAIEIASSGERLPSHKQGPTIYKTLQIGLTRQRRNLYRAIDQRVETMFQVGLSCETEWLYDQNLVPNLPVLQDLGYKEVRPYLLGLSTIALTRKIL